jgi:molecular chaperone GrpE
MTDDALEQQPGGTLADPGMVPAEPAEPADAPAGPAPVGDIDALTADLARCNDRLLRVAAEYDNYRKRTERERREQTERTVSALLLDVLAAVDDFELALRTSAAAGTVEAYRTGVELIHRRLLELLARRDVTPIDAVGADFDPNLHQAVTAEPAGNRRDGEVIEELRRGYRIGERLLRPAMVKVART